MKRTCLVVVFSPLCFGEGVVCVVDGLEFASAFGSFVGVGGDAVGVPFQGGFLVGSADLFRGGGGGDFENSVCRVLVEGLGVSGRGGHTVVWQRV